MSTYKIFLGARWFTCLAHLLHLISDVQTFYFMLLIHLICILEKPMQFLLPFKFFFIHFHIQDSAFVASEIGSFHNMFWTSDLLMSYMTVDCWIMRL